MISAIRSDLLATVVLLELERVATAIADRTLFRHAVAFSVACLAGLGERLLTTRANV